MNEALYMLGGMVIGGVIAWLVASRRHAHDSATVAYLRDQLDKADQQAVARQQDLDAERQTRVAAETKLAESVRQLEEQKQFLQDTAKQLSDRFKALAGDALKDNRAAFLDVAKKSMEVMLTEAKGDLGKRQQAIDALVKPLAETLKRYEQQASQLEASRQKAYGGLEEQLKLLATAHQQLQRETGNLVTALRAPQVRGRWGEVTLRRVVELAGMSEHCGDFSEQVAVDDGDRSLRPDMVVHLPADRDIVIDAKVSLDAYLDALAAESDEQRSAHLARHASQMRRHMEQLSRKSYWQQFGETSPEMVVMFVPGESFVGAALDRDTKLIEDAMEKHVVIAAPTTLIAVLWAVAYGWRQEQIAKNAEEISRIGKDLYDRIRRFVELMAGIGTNLDRATDAYNKAVASMESRLLPGARKFEELGAATGQPIELPPHVETTTRMLKSNDVSAE